MSTGRRRSDIRDAWRRDLTGRSGVRAANLHVNARPGPGRVTACCLSFLPTSHGPRLSRLCHTAPVPPAGFYAHLSPNDLTSSPPPISPPSPTGATIARHRRHMHARPNQCKQPPHQPTPAEQRLSADREPCFTTGHRWRRAKQRDRSVGLAAGGGGYERDGARVCCGAAKCMQRPGRWGERWPCSVGLRRGRVYIRQC